MMTTAEGGLAYQRWLATINQVCGHFAARPLEESFHGEIDARYAGSLKVSTVTAAGVNLYRTRNEIKRDNDAGSIPCFSSPAKPSSNRTIASDAGGRRYHVNRRRPPMLHRLAADLASARCCCRASGWRPQGTSLPPAGWTNLCQWSSSASDCCWKAWAARRSPPARAKPRWRRSPACCARCCISAILPFPAGKAVSEDYCVNRCVHSVGASASGVAGQRDGHVGTQPVPAVCRSGAGGGAVY